MEITINKFIKRWDEAISLYSYLFVILLAAVGFITGTLSLGMWFVERIGEFPPIIIWIFKGADFMIYLGIFLVAFKLYLILIKKVIIPALQKRHERREKMISHYQNALAKMIAKEINKSKKGRK